MAKKQDATRVVLPGQDKKYELMLILQPDLLESATEKKLRDFEQYLEENGGTVDMKDNWGKRKLAYKIGKFDTGTYVVYNITLPNDFNQELDEHMRIDKDIIRFLHVSVKDDYNYTKFEEEKVVEEPKKEAPSAPRKPTTTHRASSREKTTTEIKDKGKKADAESLDEKLDKLLEGDDLNI
ncbi:30S ribosomal protein S6 [Patescibacteria group bacterium]|nr:30S ribosomal protein S6 [Patescibacteria group bacterium]MBU1015645.1 30S ribosomal protein S6 [Patescibacteria group bacterium]MBU1684780.1 30S ribosomal protein S6 [Patescibacteria group bacterium]MBU1938214.1 30S ribosomal protein S6 [Patescibacteria group bacterium]